MASRFKEAPDWVVQMVADVRKERFEDALMGAEILVLWDTKKRLSQGRYVFGQMKLAKDLERMLTESNILPDGYHYIMSLDMEVFQRIEHADRVRLIRHELRHGEKDPENQAKPWKIRPHDIEDFKVEMALNEDDPRWGERLAEVAGAIYEDGAAPPIQDPRMPQLNFEQEQAFIKESEELLAEISKEKIGDNPSAESVH